MFILRNWLTQVDLVCMQAGSFHFAWSYALFHCIAVCVQLNRIHFLTLFTFLCSPLAFSVLSGRFDVHSYMCMLNFIKREKETQRNQKTTTPNENKNCTKNFTGVNDDGEIQYGAHKENFAGMYLCILHAYDGECCKWEIYGFNALRVSAFCLISTKQIIKFLNVNIELSIRAKT